GPDRGGSFTAGTVDRAGGSTGSGRSSDGGANAGTGDGGGGGAIAGGVHDASGARGAASPPWLPVAASIAGPDVSVARASATSAAGAFDPIVGVPSDHACASAAHRSASASDGDIIASVGIRVFTVF